MNSELNIEALRTLYKPWEEPKQYRTAQAESDTARIIPGRRKSRALLVPSLRNEVASWRHNNYIGASETSKTLLKHWFETAHPNDFRYHFCQREAIETIIWLYEAAKYRTLSSMYTSLLNNEDNINSTLIAGIKDEENMWARYCCKVATGGGKTKIMSMVLVWSYFHSIFESESDLARHFVIIAPNIIVFERLMEDFTPDETGRRIFERDPLIPQEWLGDFDLQVVLQDSASGSASKGMLYLTNIHRLYERRNNGDDEFVYETPWSGPTVKKATALNTGEELRKRISNHPKIIVLNDEAHHLHDPESSWNEAIETLHQQLKSKGRDGIIAQIDFTATPKYNNGNLFKNIVCDFPLGEAVDAGIVKTPVIGKSDELIEMPFENASQKYHHHLVLGYKQYESMYAEWEKTHKPILFVMTEDTPAANDIAHALDSEQFPLLKGRVINLHTKLKGKIKRRKGGEVEFEYAENQIKDEDLKEIRKLSRELDSPNSPYRCVVSVLMLREGWDVKNVTTIIPLRAYKANSNILAEQTLGRGLRRMTGPGDMLERVTVVEHESFVKLYRDELEGEGLFPVDMPIDKPQATTVSIFPDPKKDIPALDIEIPCVSASSFSIPTIQGLTFEEVAAFFKSKYRPLPVGKASSRSVEFTEKTLFTHETVAKYTVDRSLLAFGPSAVSVYVKQLEKACRIQSAHAVLAPIIQQFIEEVLFEQKVSIYGNEISERLSSPDVIEHIQATFAPLITNKTVTKEDRRRLENNINLSWWKPYQATVTQNRPCVSAVKTLFNLAPCNRSLEAQFVDFCDNAEDVAAFAKNAGPQKLMIDYINQSGRQATYTPDFFVRLIDGTYMLVETKGQEDENVPYKAQAALSWCDTASTKKLKWTYVFVPQVIFDLNNEFSMMALERACRPKLKALIDQIKMGMGALPFDATPEEVKQEKTNNLLDKAGVTNIPQEIMQYVEQAINQLDYDRKKNNPQLGMAFQPLLYPIEFLCGQILSKALSDKLPISSDEKRYYFEPYINELPTHQANALKKNQNLLRKNLVYGDNCNRIGVLLFCLDFALNWDIEVDGVWRDVVDSFDKEEYETLHKILSAINNFRGTYVAHFDEILTDGEKAEQAMVEWIQCLALLLRITE